MNDFKIQPPRISMRRHLIEEAKPHWVSAIAAVVAALGSAAVSSSSQQAAARKAAGAAAVPKPEAQGYTPSAGAFAAPGQKQGAGAQLSTSFSQSALPELPKGQSASDVFRLADALGKTDFSAGAVPPPPGGSAAAAQDFGGRPTIGAAEASLPTGGETTSGGSDWLKNAQTYAQLGALAQNALKGQQPPGGGIPQAAPMSYSPTADAAMKRLQQLLTMRRGY